MKEIPASGYFSIEKISQSRWTFYLLFALIFLLTHLRQNSHSNYGCEICSDKAGYYMYLPAAVHYGFHANAYPSKLDIEHGSGFHFDTTSNKVITKFTCGVALMQAPFYLAGAAINSVFGLEEEPYSRYYLLFINIGLALYCTVGLYLLKKWLRHYVDERSAFLAMLITFFGTNLYYYTLDESLMSHAYSFVLLSVTLYSVKRWIVTSSFRYFVAFSFAIALATLIRPTNILFVVIALFLDVRTLAALAARIRLLFTIRTIAVACATFFLVFLPQMIYWKFAYNQYVVWSYTGEGFTNWNNPWLMTVWFSPQSGLFPYTPILLLSLAIACYGLIRKKSNSLLVLGIFLVVSYLCASWSNPYFGECNFGKRPMVEYLPLLMLPIAWALQDMRKRTGILKWSVISMIVICTVYNLWLFGGFDTCFGGTQWEWSRFGEIIAGGTLLP